MPDYTVTSAIQAAQRYEPGETIPLTTKEAKELALLGAIDPKPLKASKQGGKGKDADTTGSTDDTTTP